jgi:hypothetical protein
VSLLSLPYTYNFFSLPWQFVLKFLITHGITDPSLIHRYTGAAVQTPVTSAEQTESQPCPMYPPPPSPTTSNHSAQISRPIKQCSKSPYLLAYQNYPCVQRRPSPSHQSYSSQDGSFDSDESRECGRCIQGSEGAHTRMNGQRSVL